ncbi:acidic leucine-rich nuclear phosphoprotein 32 family member A-like [Nasonia vitripennis]|uniref:Uncharacterized protein n=1 Tax=Nasonia vitripennis TaxID=7425 RepID=A0A7M7Q5L0_NASVI|nr:acidic leucine-rich nuclear phosphoprotein 32 family member A-like [Nasonia vitripennis]
MYMKSKYSQVGFANLLGLTTSPSKKSASSSNGPKASSTGNRPEVVDLTNEKSATVKKAVITEMKQHNENIQQLGAELTKAINDGFKSLVTILARMLSAMYNQHVAQNNVDLKSDVKEEQTVNGYEAIEYDEDDNNELKEEEEEKAFGENEDEQMILAGELFEDDPDDYEEEYLAEFLQNNFDTDELSKERFPDDP